MNLAVFLNSIRLPNVHMTIIYYNRPYGEPLEAVKAELSEYDFENSPYLFMKVYSFDLVPVDGGYNLLVKIY